MASNPSVNHTSRLELWIIDYIVRCCTDDVHEIIEAVDTVRDSPMTSESYLRSHVSKYLSQENLCKCHRDTLESLSTNVSR